MSIQNNFPAIKPTLLLDFANVEALDPRITYTRATTATYYDGKTVALAEQNFFSYSQEFDNAYWGKSGATVTANTAVAPDGTLTADTLVIGVNAVGVVKTISGVTNGVPYTWSVYVNGIAGTVINVGCNFPNSYQQVTLTGTWQRVTGTLTPTDGNISFHFRSDYPVPAGQVGAFTCFAWGAQLEQRSSVTAYTPTTTAPITNYIPVLLTAASGVARFQHNPTTGESLGLLIEEQRTNLVNYSEQFDNPYWSKSSGVLQVNSNQLVSPAGTLTAGGITFVAASGIINGRNIRKDSLVSPGVTVSFSLYAKAGNLSKIQLRLENGAYGFGDFDLNTGVATTIAPATNATMQLVGNGWYRCSVTLTNSGALAASCNFGFFASSATTTGIGNDLFVWGAQLEAGAFATSYIPTVASQITRANDAASMTGANFSSWYRQDEGTLFTEASTVRTSGYGNIFQLAESALSRTDMGLIGSSGYEAITINGTGVAAWDNTNVINVNKYASGVFAKASLAYALDNSNAAVNGVAGTIDTSCTFPVAVLARIGTDQSNRYLNGTIKKIAYYPIRIQNAQLQGLTS